MALTYAIAHKAKTAGYILYRFFPNSLATFHELKMFRYQAAFGGKVRSRKFENPVVDVLLQCAALNRLIQIAKPDTV